MARRAPRLRPLCLQPWWLLLAAGLAGCSGTPFGDNLGESFPRPTPAGQTAPGDAGATAADPAPAEPGATATAPTATAPTAEERAAEEREPAASAARSGDAAEQSAAKPLAPAPYRLTLRLPAADPAAPAEAVTRALRAAGLSFEVEMIERIPAAAAPAPAAVPAPAPAN